MPQKRLLRQMLTITSSRDHLPAHDVLEFLCGAARCQVRQLYDSIIDGVRAEIQRTLAAEYGTFLPDCSWFVKEAGAIRSACLVTYFDTWQAPIIAFVMTDPASKGQGLATNLIKRSMNSLLDEGYTRLCLAVTEGNTPAQHIYNVLGFEVEQSWLSGSAT